MIDAARDIQSVISFYDDLAPQYDAMTGFGQRFAKEEPVLKQFISQFGIKTALDAGSGSGFYSLLLSRIGVEVTAVDISSKMLDLLRKHSAELGLAVKTVESDFADLASVIDSPFDAVFCVGNSLPHITSKEELHQAAESFHRIIRSDGILCIQILNYDRIVKLKERIQSIKEVAGKTFIRFYDFGQDILTFSILMIEHTERGIQHQLNSVTLRPILQAELIEVLTDHGFTGIESFDSFTLHPFNAETSRDLIMIARNKRNT